MKEKSGFAKARRNEIRKAVMAFFMTAFCCILLFFLSIAVIPQDKIADQIEQSAIYMEKYDPVWSVIEGNYKLRVDYYDDAVLFNIIYHQNPKTPLKSMLAARYYRTPNSMDKPATMLKDCIQKGESANEEYSRYWHGSAIFLRPLFTIFTCKQIYIMNGLLLILLTIANCMIWIKGNLKKVVAAFLTGLVICNGYIVPMCIEFTTMYVLGMLSLLVFYYLIKNYPKLTNVAFFVTLGVLTNFFDFLTTELLPVLLCLILYYTMKEKESGIREKEDILFGIKNMLGWLFGYGGMWMLKWILTAAFTDVSVLDSVLSHGHRWSLETEENISLMGQMLKAIGNNIGTLMPFGFLGEGFNLVAVLVVVVLLCIIFLYRKKNFALGKIYLLIAALPILRICLLSQHAYMHSTMTHRALMPLVMGLYLIIDGQLIRTKRK